MHGLRGLEVVPYKERVLEIWRARALGFSRARPPALLVCARGVVIPRLSNSLCLLRCTQARDIKHNNVAYPDDTDGHVSAEHDSEFPMESVIENMRESAKNRTT